MNAVCPVSLLGSNVTQPAVKDAFVLPKRGGAKGPKSRRQRAQGHRFNFVSIRGSRAAGHTWPISDEDILVRKSSLLFYGDPKPHALV